MNTITLLQRTSPIHFNRPFGKPYDSPYLIDETISVTSSTVKSNLSNPIVNFDITLRSEFNGHSNSTTLYGSMNSVAFNELCNDVTCHPLWSILQSEMFGTSRYLLVNLFSSEIDWEVSEYDY